MDLLLDAKMKSRTSPEVGQELARTLAPVTGHHQHPALMLAWEAPPNCH